MHLISNKRLRAFGEEHPGVAGQLQTWRKLVEKIGPKNYAELKAAFGAVDVVGDLFVFDIKGNHFRVVCGIDFNTQRCYVKHVMTHADYDRGKWKK